MIPSAKASIAASAAVSSAVVVVISSPQAPKGI
jgi:hypothetical protein